MRSGANSIVHKNAVEKALDILGVDAIEKLSKAGIGTLFFNHIDELMQESSELEHLQITIKNLEEASHQQAIQFTNYVIEIDRLKKKLAEYEGGRRGETFNRIGI